MTEASFDSVQAHKDNQRRPGYMEILRPDERRFADGKRAVMHYAEEWPVLSGERTLNRVFYFRRRRPGLSRVEFQQRWLEGMRAVFSADRRATEIAAYVQNHTVSEAEHPDGDDARHFDVIDELFFAERGGLASLGSDAAACKAVRRLEEALLDRTRTRAFIVETVINTP